MGADAGLVPITLDDGGLDYYRAQLQERGSFVLPVGVNMTVGQLGVICEAVGVNSVRLEPMLVGDLHVIAWR